MALRYSSGEYLILCGWSTLMGDESCPGPEELESFPGSK